MNSFNRCCCLMLRWVVFTLRSVWMWFQRLIHVWCHLHSFLCGLVPSCFTRRTVMNRRQTLHTHTRHAGKSDHEFGRCNYVMMLSDWSGKHERFGRFLFQLVINTRTKWRELGVNSCLCSSHSCAVLLTTIKTSKNRFHSLEKLK